MKSVAMFVGLLFLSISSLYSIEASNTESNGIEQIVEDTRGLLERMKVSAELTEIIDVDLSHRIIVTADQKTSIQEDADAEDASSYASSDDLSKKLEEQIINSTGAPKKKIHTLSLAKTAMNDAAFAEVTDRLVPAVSFENHDSILDLSFNGLTSRSVLQIIRWIDEAHVRFINLHGNPQCSMKYVVSLCHALKVSMQGNEREVQRLMGHIIFLPKYYIYQAKTRVKVYRQLQENGYLPDNWAEIQKEYYVALYKNKLVFFAEEVFDKDPDADL
jgi:hypothetical protein